MCIAIGQGRLEASVGEQEVVGHWYMECPYIGQEFHSWRKHLCFGGGGGEFLF